MQFNFRKQDFRVLMFPDASDLFWEGFLKQVPEEDLVNGIPVMDMAHEPLGFVSGGFKRSQLNWAVVDKEAFVILSVCRRLSYLLWDGFDIFLRYRNLAYIFSPVACAATLSKSTSQRLLNWRIFMSEFSYVIRHIPGVENHWGDLLSRLRSVGGGATDSGEEVPVYVRSIAVVAPTDDDYSFPSMGEIRDRQEIYTDGKAVLDSPLGSVVRGENGLYRVDYGGVQIIWVPPAEKSLHVRLMACAHMQEAGHRGICATMHRLGADCVWEGMKEDVAEFVQQCLNCVDSRAGNVVPRPLGEILYGTEVGEVLHFDYLKLGDSDDGYAYVLVLVDDVSSFVSL